MRQPGQRLWLGRVREPCNVQNATHSHPICSLTSALGAAATGFPFFAILSVEVHKVANVRLGDWISSGEVLAKWDELKRG